MNDMPLVSVVVPVYNLEKYIGKCLDSIINQTYSNIEIIVVNDGSQDNSLGIVNDYVERYPKKIQCINVENGGVSKARQLGVNKAKGDYIGFVDGDDWIDVDMYELLVNNALKYNADISHCGFKICKENDEIKYFHNTGIVKIQNNNTGLTDLLDGSLIEPGLWNKIFKSELFVKISDNIDKTFRFKYNEDLLLNFMLFKVANKSIFDDQCKYSYVVRKSSATRMSVNQRSIQDPVMVHKLMLELCPDSLKDEMRERCLRCYIRSYENVVLNRNDMKDIAKELRLEIKKGKQYIKRLSKPMKMRGYLIIYCPHVYKFFESIYVKYFQKKIYE